MSLSNVIKDKYSEAVALVINRAGVALGADHVGAALQAAATLVLADAILQHDPEGQLVKDGLTLVAESVSGFHEDSLSAAIQNAGSEISASSSK